MNHAEADLFVREHLDRPFNWKSNNCCTFTAGFVRAYTGVDYLVAEDHVGGVRAARRRVAEHGDLAGTVSARLGEPVAPAFAQYGDVVLLPNTKGVGDSIGICIGANVLAPGPKGLERVPLSAATLAWRLPVDHPA